MADTKRVQDMISRLPDDVLLFIIEKLTLEEEVKTGLLSRRWRHVWKYITRIYFGPSWEESTGKEIVPSVDHFVSLHLGPKIESFHVEFTYESNMADQVDSWIFFAVKKNVETLYLDFDTDNDNHGLDSEDDLRYKLHPHFFQCESLAHLVLRFCHLEVPDFCYLKCLRVIRLLAIELLGNAIHKLTSNTPVLEELALFDCNRTCNLYIDVAPNPHFHTLGIADIQVDHANVLEINAPSVRKLIMFAHLPRKEYRIKNISQCDDVRLNLSAMFENAQRQNYEDLLLKFIAKFQHAKTLELCNWCVQVVSQNFTSLVNPFQNDNYVSSCLQLLSVRETRNIGRLSFRCTNLKLDSCFRIWEIPGITYMLRACHEVESLVILIANSDSEILRRWYPMNLGQDVMEESKVWREQEHSLVARLQNLKVVKFQETRDEYYTWKKETFELESFFRERENGMKLLRQLIQNAQNLSDVIFSNENQEVEFIVKKGDLLPKKKVLQF